MVFYCFVNKFSYDAGTTDKNIPSVGNETSPPSKISLSVYFSPPDDIYIYDNKEVRYITPNFNRYDKTCNVVTTHFSHYQHIIERERYLHQVYKKLFKRGWGRCCIISTYYCLV